MLILDSIPKISDDFNKSLKDLRNYIIDLNAWLRHQLYHLEIENFTDETKDKIVGIKNVNTDSATRQSVLIEISKAVQNATELITGHQGGYVVLNPAEKPSEILVMDTDDITTATKVWRWNGAGLGYSSTGYDGTYGLAMTMDGAINADFITAGKITSLELVSATITGGTININDKFKVDTLGNVTMTGAISWGAENSPVKVQYSMDGSTLWHDTFASGDTFARYSYDGGVTYTEAVKIIGTDGIDGQDGQDGAAGADGTPSYTYIRYSEQSDGTGFVATPTATTKYIGIQVTSSGTASVNKADYTWSKYQGDDASVPSYIKETYIDMTSVSSPYILGASVQGGAFVQYPVNRGWGLYVGDNVTTNNFITTNSITPFDWFEINDVVNIGTTKWGSEIASARTITNKYDNGDGKSTFVFNGAAVALTGGNYMHKKVSAKMFTVYSQNFVNPETPLDDSYVVGGIEYENLGGPLGTKNIFTVYASLGSEFYIASQEGMRIISSQSYSDIEINAGRNLVLKGQQEVGIEAQDGIGPVNIVNPVFWVNGEGYQIVDGVGIGNTTVLIRTA